jgi:hypothetical protein
VTVGVAVLELADAAALNEGGAADAVSGAAADTNTPTNNDNAANQAALTFNMLRQLSAQSADV